nr:DUF3592 domain-containing protein [Prauserella cavernicola]
MLLVAAIGLAVSLVVAGPSVRRHRSRVRLWREGVRCRGVVIGHDTCGSNGDRLHVLGSQGPARGASGRPRSRLRLGGQDLTRYRPVVQYQTGQGDLRIGRPDLWKLHTAAFVPGRKVRIAYDSDNPSRIVIAGYPAWQPPLAGVVLAAILATASTLLLGILAPSSASSTALISVAGIFVPFALLAIAVTAAGAVGTLGALRVRLGPRYTGTVTSRYSCDSPLGSTLHHTVVRWRHPASETDLEAATTRGRLESRHDIGATIVVCSDKYAPTRILVDGDGPSPWSAVALAVGLLMLTVALTLISNSWGFVFRG